MTGVGVLPAKVPDLVASIKYKGIDITIDEAMDLRVNMIGYYCFSPLQTKILLLLMSEPGVVWSKDCLMHALYPKPPRRDMKIVDVEICFIRKKFVQRNPELRDLITTVWGRGYMIGESRPSVEISLAEQVAGNYPINGGLDVADLPHPSTFTRWVVSRKALAVELVKSGKITLDQLLSKYPELSESEFRSWERGFQAGGSKALRITYLANHAAA
jgi:hypothetical protein